MANNKPPLPPEELRRALLDMSPKQAALKKRLKAYLSSMHKAVGTVGREVGMPWASINDFVEGRTAIKRSKGLSGLSKLLDCEELGEEIAVISDKIGDRYLALSLQSQEVIDVVIELIKALRQRSDDYTLDDFAGGFHDNAEVVKGVVNGSREALAKLADPELLNVIQEQLLLDLDDPIEMAKQRRLAAQKAAGKQLEQLIEPLIDSFSDKTSTAKALGLPRGALSSALNGHSSLEQINKVSKIAQGKLKAIKAAGTEVRKSTRPLPPKPTPSPPGPSPDKLAAQASAVFGGTATDDGIDFVLTQDNYRSVEGLPVELIEEHLLALLPLVRRWLNLGSQAAEHQLRKQARKRLAREVEELELAIRLFTFAHPNKLLELYDGQRAEWAKDSENLTDGLQLD
jgi:hypothetical protein